MKSLLKSAMQLSLLSFALWSFAGCGSSPVARPQVPAYFHSQLHYTYPQLLLMSMGRFQTIVQESIHKGDAIVASGQNDPEMILPYYEDALRTMLSRPDQDGALSPLYDSLSEKLDDLNILPLAIEQITTEGIYGMLSGNTTSEQKATYVYLLTNLISQLKPAAPHSRYAYDSIKRIRDAGLTISDDVQQEIQMRTLNRLESPSIIARRVLRHIRPPKT